MKRITVIATAILGLSILVTGGAFADIPSGTIIDQLHTAIQSSAANQNAFANIYGVAVAQQVGANADYVDKLVTIVADPYFVTVSGYINHLTNADALDKELQLSGTARAAFLAMYNISVPAAASTSFSYIQKLFGIVGDNSYPGTTSYMSLLDKAYTLHQSVQPDAAAGTAFTALYGIAPVDPPSGSAAYVTKLFSIVADTAYPALVSTFVNNMKAAYALDQQLQGDAAAKSVFATVYGVTVTNPASINPSYVAQLFGIVTGGTYPGAASFVSSLKSAGTLDNVIDLDPAAQTAFTALYLDYDAANGAAYNAKIADLSATNGLTTLAKVVDFVADMKDAYLLDQALQADAAAKTAFADFYATAVVNPARTDPAYVTQLYAILGDAAYTTPASYVAKLKAADLLDNALQADAAAKTAFARLYGLSVASPASNDASYVSKLFGISSDSSYPGTAAAFIANMKAAYNVDAAVQASAARKTAFNALFGITVPADPATAASYVARLFGIATDASYTTADAFADAMVMAYDLDQALQADPAAKTAFETIYGVTAASPASGDAAYVAALFGAKYTNLADYISGLKSAGDLDKVIDLDAAAQLAFTGLYEPYDAADGASYLTKIGDLVFTNGLDTMAKISAFVSGMKEAYDLDRALQLDAAAKTAFLNMYGMAVVDPARGNPDYVKQLYGITGGSDYTTPSAYITLLKKAQDLDRALQIDSAGKTAFQALFGKAVVNPASGSANYVKELFGIVSGSYYPATPEEFISNAKAAYNLHQALMSDADAKAAFQNAYAVTAVNPASDDAAYVAALFGVKYTNLADFIAGLKAANNLDTALQLDAAAQAAFANIYGITVNGVGYQQKLSDIANTPGNDFSTMAKITAWITDLKKVDELDQAIQADAAAQTAFLNMYGVATANPPSTSDDYVKQLFGIVTYSGYTTPASYLSLLKKAQDLDRALQLDAAAKTAFLNVYGLTVVDPASASAAYVEKLFSIVSGPDYQDETTHIANLKAVHDLDRALQTAADPAKTAFFTLYGEAVVDPANFSSDYVTDLFGIVTYSGYAGPAGFIASMDLAYALDLDLRADAAAVTAFQDLYGVTVPLTTSTSAKYVAQLFGIVTNKHYTDTASYLSALKKTDALDLALRDTVTYPGAKAQFEAFEGLPVPANPYDNPIYLAKIFDLTARKGYTDPATYLTALNDAYIYHEALIGASAAVKAAFKGLYNVDPVDPPSSSVPYIERIYIIVTNVWYSHSPSTSFAGMQAVYDFFVALSSNADRTAAFKTMYGIDVTVPPSDACIGKMFDIVGDYTKFDQANYLNVLVRAAELERRLNGRRYSFATINGISTANQYVTNADYVKKLFDTAGDLKYSIDSRIFYYDLFNILSGRNVVEADADYIQSCQNTTAADAAYGAINNVYPAGGYTYVVPREMGMAILGLIEASGNYPYSDSAADIKAARLAASFLAKIQNSDGSWCNQYSGVTATDLGKSPTQTAEVMIALNAIGFDDDSMYAAMKKGAQFLIDCQAQSGGKGLLVGGKDSSGSWLTDIWTSDNAYAYQALKAAENWARAAGDAAFAAQCRNAAAAIISGIDTYLYVSDTSSPAYGVWLKAINSSGAAIDPFGKGYEWINYAPALLDLPAFGADKAAVGTWIHNMLQQADGSVLSCTSGAESTRKSPGFAFEAILTWLNFGQYDYVHTALDWAQSSGLWQKAKDANGSLYGWVDWLDDTASTKANYWERFIDTSFYAIAAMMGGYDFSPGKVPEWGEYVPNNRYLLPADFDNSGTSDLCVDFGTNYGLHLYSNSAWTRINAASPSSMSSADTDGDGAKEIVANFTGYGLYLYDNSAWTVLNSANTTSTGFADIDGDGSKEIIANFAGYGLYCYDNSSWTVLNSVNTTSTDFADIDGDGSKEIIANFAGYGLYCYNNSSWTVLNSVNTTSTGFADIDGDGSQEVIANFAGYGLYLYDNSSWSVLNTTNTVSTDFADIDGDGVKEIIAEFAGYGLYAYDNSVWTRLNSVTPSSEPQEAYVPRGDEDIRTRFDLESNIVEADPQAGYTMTGTLADPPKTESLLPKL
jgi:uncharacterized protein YdeI (YjbR/CyaY-like superfamily)